MARLKLVQKGITEQERKKFKSDYGLTDDEIAQREPSFKVENFSGSNGSVERIIDGKYEKYALDLYKKLMTELVWEKPFELDKQDTPKNRIFIPGKDETKDALAVEGFNAGLLEARTFFDGDAYVLSERAKRYPARPKASVNTQEHKSNIR